jgi:glycosyltransferase involved in cell wall biosynthesis
MTRILIVSGYYPPNIVGGGDISTRIMSEALSEAGSEILVLTCANEESHAVRNGVPIHFVKSPNLYWRFGAPRSSVEKMIWHGLENYNPRAGRLLARTIRQFQPDALITSTLENFGISAWTAAADLGVPAIHIIRSFYLQCWRGSRFKKGCICQTPCLDCGAISMAKKLGSQKVRGVIGISNDVLKSHLTAGYFQHAQSARIFNPIEVALRNHRAETCSSRMTFGYLGALQPSKGIEELVRAFSADVSGCRLMIAGKGDPEYLAMLRALANPANTEFLGWTQPADLFEKIDYLIFPSLWNEPFGRGIAEAMGYGIPVIGARRGGIPELIDDGKNGILYEPDSVASLKQAIDTAIAGDYAAFSRNALGGAGRFAKGVVSKQYLDFIEGVISTQQATRNVATQTVPPRRLISPAAIAASGVGHRIERVLILAANYPPNIIGGGEIATQILAEGLAGVGIKVRVVTCSERENSHEEGNISVSAVASPNIYWRYLNTKPNAKQKSLMEKAAWHLLDNYNPRTKGVMAEAIAEFKPDVVLTSILENFGAATWLAANQAKVPVIDIVHSYYLQCVRASRFRQGKNCTRICGRCRAATFGKRYLSRYVDGVIGVSRHILKAHTLEGYFPNAKQTYIYNPVEGRAAEPRALRRSGVPTFGYLGKMLPTKGIGQIVSAFSRGDTGGRLVVAGDGDPDFEAELRRSADPNFVSFLGWVDPQLLFDQIDFLIFPSLWNEPFGRGVAEAMSRGIPVLGADRGGIPELIDDGRDGFLYDPAIPGRLELAIKMAIGSDYALLSKGALGKSGRFSKQLIIGQFAEFMENVAFG